MEFTTFDQHIVLYAKSWYKETNTIEDLKVIISKISLMDTKYISDYDVLNLVSFCLHKVLSKSQTDYDLDLLYKSVWEGDRLFTYKTSLTMTDIVNSHLRVMRYKRREFCPVLPTPNPDYLPLAHEDTLEVFAKINS